MNDLAWLEQYNVTWTSQSQNAGESMPVSGGDIGLNAWGENDELMVYLGRAGYRDENGAILWSHVGAVDDRALASLHGILDSGAVGPGRGS